uniref:Uncharacterized protein n=1 Tax=Anguilla anguilla TaxID=7936 RepID=A0A0E9UX30_ANGAN
MIDTVLCPSYLNLFSNKSANCFPILSPASCLVLPRCCVFVVIVLLCIAVFVVVFCVVLYGR